MIVLRRERVDAPNELAVYLTADQFDRMNLAIANEGIAGQLSEISEKRQRDYYRSIAELSQDQVSKRHIIDLGRGAILDSEELGHDLVARFETPTDPNIFDPNYHAVDFNFFVLDDNGRQAIDEYVSNPDMTNSDRLEKALDTARVVVSFCLEPPNLA